MFMKCEDGVLRHGKRAITLWAPENSDAVFICDGGKVIGSCMNRKEADMIYDLALHLVGEASVSVRSLRAFFRNVSRCCRRLELCKVEDK